MRNRRLAIVVAGLFAVTSIGCYGRFALTRKIYDWNGRAVDGR